MESNFYDKSMDEINLASVKRGKIVFYICNIREKNISLSHRSEKGISWPSTENPK